MKILFVSHTTNFVKFNIPYIKMLKDLGHEVHYASAEEEKFPINLCEHFKIDFERNPLNKKNIYSYKQLVLLLQKEKYDLVHCHTPVGGAIARLAVKTVKKRGINTKVMYTVHGFHFFKGAPLVNWLCYYPVEKYLSKYTDCLVTVNDEDYKNAIKRNFKANQIRKMNGVGVNLERFTFVSEKDRDRLRNELHFSKEDFILVCVGELNKNKGQNFLINQMRILEEYIPNIKLVLLGKGDMEEKYKAMAKDNENIIFAGYRTDVDLFCKMSDVLVSASHREGLPVNLLEGMACALPIVCTNVRGQRDLIQNGKNGFVYEVENSEQFVSSILKLYRSSDLRKRMGETSLQFVKKYELSKCVEVAERIYKDILMKEDE